MQTLPTQLISLKLVQAAQNMSSLRIIVQTLSVGWGLDKGFLYLSTDGSQNSPLYANIANYSLNYNAGTGQKAWQKRGTLVLPMGFISVMSELT